MEKYKLRYDDVHGRPIAISTSQYDVIHVLDSERTMANIHEFIKILNDGYVSNRELLMRDSVWLPEKDDEIEQLRVMLREWLKWCERSDYQPRMQLETQTRRLLGLQQQEVKTHD